MWLDLSGAEHPPTRLKRTVFGDRASLTWRDKWTVGHGVSFQKVWDGGVRAPRLMETQYVRMV